MIRNCQNDIAAQKLSLIEEKWYSFRVRITVLDKA